MTRLAIAVLAASAALSGTVAAAATQQTFKASFHALSLSFADPPRRIAISLPAGTRLEDGRRIGSGSASLNTGFAPPLTEIPASVTIAKRTRRLILNVVPQGGDLSPFTLTADVGRSKVTIAVPPMCVAGYTPCHEIALDRLSMSFRSLRPSRCPRSGRWTFTATVTYRDGPPKTTRAAVSCRRAGRA